MKKFLVSVCMLTFLSGAAVFGADDGITLNVDGEELVCDVAPQIIDGRTMVPVRAIFEAVGADVSYDGETKTVTAVKEDTTVVMTVDSSTETINGEEVAMDTSPVIVDGRTLAPARYVAEAFGYSVSWDGDTKTVSITAAEEATTEAPTETTTEAAEETTLSAEERYGLDFSAFLDSDISPSPIEGLDDETAAIHKTVRYNFEQVYLYQKLTKNKTSLSSDLKNEDYGSFAAAVESYWDENVTAYSSNLHISSAAKYDLTASDNFSVVISKINEDITMVMLEMAEDSYIPSCRYIAVLYDADYNFKYYMLEESYGGYYTINELTENKGSSILTSNTTVGAFHDITAVKDIKSEFLNIVCSKYFA